MNIQQFLVLVVTTVTLSGCAAERHGLKGSGKVITDKRELSGMLKSVQLNAVADYKISIGPSTSVSITADDNLAPLVKTSLDGGNLRIELDRDKGDTSESGSGKSHRVDIEPSKNMVITITTPHLQSVQFNAAGGVDINGLDEDRFDLIVAGAGNTSASGKVKSATINITGAGNAKLEKLAARDVSVTIAGAGDVDVDAEESIDAQIKGAGNIKVKGHPKKVTQNVTGAGSVTMVQ